MYEYLATARRIVDGDTVDLDIDLGLDTHAHVRVRLSGIDAPESYGVKKNSEEYRKGIAAKKFLEGLLESKDLRISTSKDKKGKYGRYIVIIHIYVGDTLVNVSDEMVRAGHAVFKKY